MRPRKKYPLLAAWLVALIATVAFMPGIQDPDISDVVRSELHMFVQKNEHQWESEFPLGFGVAYISGEKTVTWSVEPSELSFDWNHFRVLGVQDGILFFDPPKMEAPGVIGGTFEKFGIEPIVGSEIPLMQINDILFSTRIVLSHEGKLGVLFGANRVRLTDDPP